MSSYSYFKTIVPAPVGDNFPFKIFTRVDSKTNKTFWGVNYFSRVWASLLPKPEKKLSITGLLGENPTDTDPGWRPMIDWDIIWLTVIFNAGSKDTPYSLFINSLGKSDKIDLDAKAWAKGKKGYVQDNADPNNLHFQTARKMIAYVKVEDLSQTIVQMVDKDQLLTNIVIDGRAAIFPEDYSGGYPYEKK